MSLNIEGRKCVVCHAYLFEEDDVVFCPECGAPHHRDCYKAVGHCNLADLHGTVMEYKFEPVEEEVEKIPEPDERGSVCKRCGKEIEKDAQFCPYCGSVNLDSVKSGVFGLGQGINFDEKLEDNITVREAANVVMANTTRYIPKFRSLNKNNKLSWNWAAFLLPHGWFAFRKMYGAAFLTGALMIAATLLFIPMQIVLNQAPENEVRTYFELFELMAAQMSEAGTIPMIFALLSSAVNLLTRIISALFGDWIYRNRVLDIAAEIKESDNVEEKTAKRGGISVFAFGVAVFAVYVIPGILAVFI